VTIREPFPCDEVFPIIGIAIFYPIYPAVILSYFSCYYIFVNKKTKGHLMLPIKKALPLALAISLLPAQGANAWWSINPDANGTVLRLEEEDRTQVKANSYFNISIDEIVDAPVVGDRYAVLQGGVVDKIVTWKETTSTTGVIVKLTESGGVKYIDDAGVIRLEAINQGDIVSVQVSATKVETPAHDTTGTVVANPNPEPTGDAVADTKAPVVTAVKLESDNSVTVTVTAPVITDENKTVSIQVIADGRSYSSVGVSGNGDTVDIKAVPQDSNITVQTTVRDNTTGVETVTSNPVVATPVAPIVTPEPVRDAAADKATIVAPTVTAQAEGTNGHRSASISVPNVPNFDPNKTWATLMIVDKNGSTSAIGLDGVGKIVNVDWLSPTEEYEIKIVLRDLGSGQETTISGTRLP
jgi:hypothetical protein